MSLSYSPKAAGTPFDQFVELLGDGEDPMLRIARSQGIVIPLGDPGYKRLLGTCRRRRELLVRALFYLEHPGPHDLERRQRIAAAIRDEVTE